MSKGAGRGTSTKPLLARPVWTVAGTVLLTLAYYLMPLEADRSLWFRVALLVAVLTALASVTVRQLRRSEDPVGRVILVLIGVVMAFSLVFYVLATTVPGQFVGLETRTDALYFTVITMATVGYGDIHPTGQLSRAVMILAVSFSVVFVAALASTIVSRLRQVAQASQTQD